MVKEIFISDFDMKRFRWLVSNAGRNENIPEENISGLEVLLNNAIVSAPKDIPPYVVTMHSKVCIRDIKSGRETIMTLVFPADADTKENKLSILDPLGLAIIGCKAGDEFNVMLPAGKRTMRIEDIIYQPEAEGNYYI